jgi:7-cyano-7-deazaguanine tRNA-ribosyltransferase
MSNTKTIPEEFSEFAKTWKIFFQNNKFNKIQLEKNDFLKHYKTPKSAKTRYIKK